MEDKIKILENLIKRYENGEVGGYFFFCLDIQEIKSSTNKLQVLQDLKLIEALELCNGITYTTGDNSCVAFQKIISGKTGIMTFDDYSMSKEFYTMDMKEYNQWKIEIAKKAIELLKGI